MNHRNIRYKDVQFYQPVVKLGSGATSIVYKAIYKAITVAVKVLNGDYDDIMADLEKEVELLK